MEKIDTIKKGEKKDEAIISNIKIDKEVKQENNHCISSESGKAAMNPKELSAAAAAAIVTVALTIMAIGTLGVIVPFPHASALNVMADESMTTSGINITSSDMIDGEVKNITSTGTEEEQEEQEAKNIKTVNQLREALNTGDVSRVHEFISPEYFNHESQVDPVRSKLRGPEEFIDTVKNLRNAFADLHYEEQETIASGDKVIQILNITGKHTRNFFVIPPTGNNISYQGVHIYRIGEDGKIVEHRAIRDDLTF